MLKGGRCWRRWQRWAEKYIEHEYLSKKKQTNQPINDSGILHLLQFCGNESTERLKTFSRILVTVSEVQSGPLLLHSKRGYF